ncbi:hypothetical protein NTE_00541 [Candidatus Nitrososphaera evergladensis SR1]|jgi:hypothetical protein|uniref:Uncharacterized protein n=1 Tax=Candidatus Nitrososphaera evergladensis SR1 TaxID=1459636 RepID=A0A075MPA4_9ARCH|nr:hypothetical protein [Candidatus Nitrososphaera evergladensis]AIF82622.1 hypothetical protein NTE_00541 [Candidatus Nitrososphaera evergladensis SR1]
MSPATKSFDTEEMKENLEFVVIHLAEHADFRGEIKELDKDCVICQHYFSDELSEHRV